MQEKFSKLPLNELRQIWAKSWDKKPHLRIGRTMLEKSLEYRIRETMGCGLKPDQKFHLARLVKQYKRNSSCFDELNVQFKAGTRLVRMHEGKKHSVLIKADGFEYEGRTYSSLSKIANDITGKRWNGWVFFGLKKVGVE